ASGAQGIKRLLFGIRNDVPGTVEGGAAGAKDDDRFSLVPWR
ncbi:hypothetical protein ABIB45_004598, partial [Arthrobacter sp. UYCo732]